MTLPGRYLTGTSCIEKILIVAAEKTCHSGNIYRKRRPSKVSGKTIPSEPRNLQYFFSETHLKSN